LSSDAYMGFDQIQVGNGKGLSIHNIGSAIISSPRRSFLLKQLLHVPSICRNLLSVRQFAHDNDVGQSFTGVHLRKAFISCCLLPLSPHLHTLVG